MEERFEEAVQRFQKFLSLNGRPTNIAWITPTDVLVTGSKLLYVRSADVAEAENSARRTFDNGMRLGYGVLLKGLFWIDGVTYAYVWVPRSTDEAREALMPKGVKLQVVERPGFDVIVIQNPEQWVPLATRYADQQALRHQLFQ